AAIVLLFGAVWTARIGAADQAFVDGMTTQDPQRREARLREALDVYPEFPRARYELAQTLSALGRPAAAAELGRETLRLRPYHVEALNRTAISVLRSGGDVAEAEGDLRQAIEVAPYYYKSYFNLALLEKDQGRNVEARHLLGLSIERKPDHGASYYYRGLLFLGEGDSASARNDFRMAAGLRYDVGSALRTDRPSALNDPSLAEYFK
ncbi:MAG TPA: tetratricopeptide repeat protein, partial [Planctomycetota bacterium]|nr:tetratricopeptide repeat protein [Planctomycetota bacterium]